MSVMQKYYLSVIVIVLWYASSMHAATLLSGNGDGTTFNTPIADVLFTSDGIFTIAAQEGAADFAVAFSPINTSRFQPYAPQQVILNGVESSNPLYNQPLQHIDGLNVFKEGALVSPVMVSEVEPGKVYLIDRLKSYQTINMLSTNTLADAAGQPSAGILSLVGIPVPSSIVCTVLPSSGEPFGSAGSGIAVVTYGATTTLENGNPVVTIAQSDAISGTQFRRAFPMDVTSPFFSVNDPLTLMENNPQLLWHSRLQRFYVGDSIMTGTNATDGGLSVAYGFVDNIARLHVNSIVATSPFPIEANNAIIGGLGASATINVHRLKEMFTSTRLSYLIVNGDNGDPAQSKANVYALPLVSMFDINQTVAAAEHGMLASRHAIPVNLFASDGRWLGRQFQQIATIADDLYTNALLDKNIPARVGRGPVPAGPVSDMFVAGDSIFVTVDAPDIGQLPGMFTSQAILNDQGVIVGWTAWQRISGSTLPMFAGVQYGSTTNIVFLSGIDANHVVNVYRTNWGEGDGLSQLIALIDTFVDPNNGGIQGFTQFSPQQPGINAITLQIFTGNNAVFLAETGVLNSGVLQPITQYGNTIQQFNSGEITQTLGAEQMHALLMSGGVLGQLGPITAASPIATPQYSYLLAGGVNGLAILAQPDGTGMLNGIGDNFSGLTDGMRFMKIGNYQFVQKIIQDDHFLYILTDDQLDRIDLSTGNIGLGQFTAVTVARGAQLSRYGSLLDVIVSGKFAALACSDGLLRIDNGKDITTAHDGDVNLWKRVTVPQWFGPIQQLQAITSSGLDTDLAKSPGGAQLIVLSAYAGYNDARLNRFYVRNVGSGEAIDDNTIVPLPDMILEGQLNYYMSLGEYRDGFSYDGAGYFNDRDTVIAYDSIRNASTPRALLFQRNTIIIPLDLGQGTTFAQILTSNASGSRMVSGDFGLIVNE